MKSIPLLGTQTINSITNLKNLINSIDYPVEILSIIVNNENFSVLEEVKKFTNTLENNNIQKIEISWHPSNLGCGGSWNYHFRQYPDSEFFLNPSDDIVFAEGDLKRMVENLTKGYDMVFYSTSTKYACFGITKNALKTVGLFDDNIYPACLEDDDFDIRCRLANISQICLPQISKHISSGSSRNLKDNKEQEILSKCFEISKKYITKKWNFPINDYKTPFNNPNKEISDITYNFDFRENKKFRCNYTI